MPKTAALLPLAGASLLLTGPAAAQDAEPGFSIDATLSAIMEPVTTPFVSFIFAPLPGTELPWIVLWLITAAAIFTVYFGFVQFRLVGHAIQLVRGQYTSPDAAGEVTHFQALATAVSGTVGLGNIAGVAVAVSIGAVRARPSG